MTITDLPHPGENAHIQRLWIRPNGRIVGYQLYAPLLYGGTLMRPRGRVTDREVTVHSPGAGRSAARAKRVLFSRTQRLFDWLPREWQTLAANSPDREEYLQRVPSQHSELLRKVGAAMNLDRWNSVAGLYYSSATGSYFAQLNQADTSGRSGYVQLTGEAESHLRDTLAA